MSNRLWGRSTLRLDYKASGNETNSTPEEKLSIICTLLAGVIEQTTLSIPIFREDEAVFSVLGKNDMYLTGILFRRRDVDLEVSCAPATKALDTQIPLKKPNGLVIATPQGHNVNGTAFKGMATAIASSSKSSGSAAFGGVSNGFGDHPLSTSTPKAQASFKYKNIVKGTGDPATNGSKVTVRYTLRGQVQPQPLLSTSGDTPVVMTVGETSLVPGLAAVLPGMLVGGKRQLLVPCQSVSQRQWQNLPKSTPLSDLLLDRKDSCRQQLEEPSEILIY
ncbi:hypothetical protein CPB83DRAFT_841257 [Crepidotus variabilis]|uniref:peptidylprolyl isomerase n=1 Tax=Crepidotus variabilis TaxID=179855 RepID=A0A9P6E2U9_9AGAR|nr:hypothetical protein CPB83DRAFT_841257 [Crepidotus variabilis]